MTTTESRLGKLEGQIDGVNKRVEDIYRLLVLVIGVSASGLIAALTSVVMQVLKG